MAINKGIKAVLKALSYGNEAMDIKTERMVAELKKLDPVRIFTRKLDLSVKNGEYQVPVRVFFPTQSRMDESPESIADYKNKVLLFMHGGGWVSESVDTYERICARMAKETDRLVLAVEYRRAPEFRFPTALLDVYAAAKALFAGEIIRGIKPSDIAVAGDSAGGNLTAALSIMARDRGEFMPEKQVLIYPALWNDYTETSPFGSVRENGRDYLLTAAKMEEYLSLYERSEEDRKNPCFAPLLEEDLSGMPDTLILTAEYDPLRDEGEAFAKRLSEAGNRVELHRIPDALHGYFALGAKHMHVEESLNFINEFLEEANT